MMIDIQIMLFRALCYLEDTLSHVFPVAFCRIVSFRLYMFYLYMVLRMNDYLFYMDSSKGQSHFLRLSCRSRNFCLDSPIWIILTLDCCTFFSSKV